ncbi:DUF3105 domain-containing protein [Streptomyces sp. Li-HN-5-11]|uniref:DUF3105 domain-containing protein n=1 Tax=Streptomyces sp. Li-HN-5-11 TaxID=3075432 RepID=UPI0028ABE24F|nr:DUF3105 domain-containing protein [Streptomyces sp. Li-HN-5-11]WNM34681.1 DUF3105 domain-containing protein [Streptomyces sp. Li-HN-5-11]
MGSASNTATADRKARIEEIRRTERARERRNRILTIAASVVAVAGLVVGGVVLIHSQSDDDKSTSASESHGPKGGPGHFVTGADGVRTWQGTLGRTHTTSPVSYPMEPPVGGNHNPIWQNCNGDVYTKPIKNVNAVHSLEHGAVWVTYNSKASKADVAALAAKVRRTPYTLMSPVEDQKDPLMLSAWAHQRTVTSASDPNVDKFFAEFVQGSQTPEPGATCTGGLGQ